MQFLPPIKQKLYISCRVNIILTPKGQYISNILIFARVTSCRKVSRCPWRLKILLFGLPKSCKSKQCKFVMHFCLLSNYPLLKWIETRFLGQISLHTLHTSHVVSQCRIRDFTTNVYLNIIPVWNGLETKLTYNNLLINSWGFYCKYS